MYRINNAGTAIKEKGGNIRYAFHGTKGFADLVALKEGFKIFYIETKATGKKPTKEQLAFLAKTNKCHAIGIWADSLDEFLLKIE